MNLPALLGLRIAPIAACTLWASIALATTTPGAGSADKANKITRVLLPRVAKQLEAAFARAAPTWTLKRAQIQKDRVSATVCAGAICRDLRLSDPTVACKGDRVGAWCVLWSGAKPNNAAPLHAALASDGVDTIWHVIVEKPRVEGTDSHREDLPPAATPTAGGARAADADHPDADHPDADHPDADHPDADHPDAGATADEGVKPGVADDRASPSPKAEAGAAEHAEAPGHSAPAAGHPAAGHPAAGHPAAGHPAAATAVDGHDIPSDPQPKVDAAPGSSDLARILGLSLLLFLLSLVGYGVWRRRQRDSTTKRARKPNPGRVAMIWLGPQVLMGLWLALVPDTLAFTANQVIVLVHVVTSLAAGPVIAWFSVRHIIKTWKLLTGPGALGTIGKHGATLAVLGALISGVVVLWYGEGMPAATVHLWFGLACGVALFAHLQSLSLRQLVRTSAFVLVGAGALAAVTIAVSPHQTWAPAEPEFEYAARPVELYDDAQWCGSCHTEFYEEWQRSVHGATFKGATVQHEQKPHQAKGDFVFGLTDAGKIVRGERSEAGKPGDPPASFGTCSQCHAPTLYYSDATEGPFGAKPPVSDGVTCSFCHTLRGVRDGGRSLASAWDPATATSPRKLNLRRAFQVAPFYISAPETVRRYIGQNAKDPIARYVGDLLINWWPEMHRRDYHARFLDTAAVCQGCHGLGLEGAIHGTFIDWRDSRFAKPKEAQVTCQDCHMARKMTGEPVSEPGRHVTWGPIRPRRTTHLFTGGNADWSAKYADEETAAFQREWNSKSIEVAVVKSRVEADAVSITVEVRTPLVAHKFPSMETVLRYAWVQMQAVDANGDVVVRTRPWRSFNFSEVELKEARASVEEPMSPLIYHREGTPDGGPEDTVIEADGKRRFSVTIPLPSGEAAITTIRAQVFHSWDSKPVATAEATAR